MLWKEMVNSNKLARQVWLKHSSFSKLFGNTRFGYEVRYPRAGHLHSFTVDVARLRLGVGVTIELQHYPVGFFLRFRTGVYLARVI